MIELKTYTTKELCEALDIKLTSFKSHKEKFLKDYYYLEEKRGRSKFYTITGYKKKEDSEFIKIFKELSGKDVTFPKEDTAEKILKVLFDRDCTISDNEEIGYEVPGGLERRTIGIYIDLFRSYNALPPKKDKVPRLSFNAETGESYSKFYDPNEYVYYLVSREEGTREIISKKDYFEILKEVKEDSSTFFNEQLEIIDLDDYSSEEGANAIDQYRREASRRAW